MSSDFSNNDFSHITIDGNWFSSSDEHFCLNGCNFTNTGLRINYISPQIPPIYYEAREKLRELMKVDRYERDEEYYTKYKEYLGIIDLYSDKEDSKEQLGNEIKRGLLNDCYINDKRILTLDERQVNAQEKGIEYDSMYEELLDSTLSNINEQINGFKGK